MLLTASAVGAAALFSWSHWIEPRWFQINHHREHTDKILHKPLRILHLSDIHFADHNPFLFRFFDKLAQENFDLVFITGDIIDSDEGIERCEYNLKKLHPMYGMFAVLGNHDYYLYKIKDTFAGNFMAAPHPSTLNDSSRLIKALEAAGAQVLINQSTELEFHGRRLLIHGLDDPTTGRADFKALRSGIKAGELNLLLTHSVDALTQFEHGEIDFSFSGHSHGGQVCFPWIGAVVKHTRLGKDYVDGVKNFKGARCAISRGLHMSPCLPYRLLCRPEALMVEVRNSHHA